jgi:uncharacterized OB-fold protein
LRYLRQLRDLQLRDLGGFVFDLYRFGEKRDHLVREKLDAVIAADKERHALEELLAEHRRTHEIRQPGIGGTCPTCGDFHATDANFCARCGTDLAAGEEVIPLATEEPVPAAQTSGEASPAEWPAPDEAERSEEAGTVELDAVRKRRRAES